MSDGERIVAVGLLSQRDLDNLGGAFTRLYRIEETPCFGELLHANDVADREFRCGPRAPQGTLMAPSGQKR